MNCSLLDSFLKDRNDGDWFWFFHNHKLEKLDLRVFTFKPPSSAITAAADHQVFDI